jgi:hypothetical protein
MGALFGFIFGVEDVEDAAIYNLNVALMKEENYCKPIGIICGGFAGYVTEFLRQKV